MKKIILLISLISLSTLSYSQNQDKIWVISDSIGIDFNNLSNPMIFNNNEYNSAENFSCISDTNGQLLFYLNGYITWGNNENQTYLRLCNSIGNTMQNGDSIFTTFSETQGSVIIPYPDNDGIYIIVTEEKWTVQSIGLPYGLFYSVIDMNQNGGLGKVIQKNLPLIINKRMPEKVAAVRHANGRDWWIMTHGLNGNRFIEFLIDPSGVHGPYNQDIGSFCDSLHYNDIAGQMKFSKNGDKLAFVNLKGVCDVYNFDRCSGLLSNWIQLGDTNSAEGNEYYGCELAPSGNVLYATNIFNLTNEDYLYQWDLTAGNISASRITLWNRTNCSCDFAQMKLGPDEKIYFANMASGIWTDSCNHSINVINSPDIVGIGCNVGQYQFSLGNHQAIGGLPNIPNYNLGALTGSVCDTLTGIKELIVDNLQLTVWPNPANDELKVKSQKSKVKSLLIRDLLSRVVLVDGNVNSSEVTLDVSALTPGIYFVEVKTKDGVYSQKFVKE